MSTLLDDPIITSTSEALETFADERNMGFDLETSGLSFMADEIAVVSLYGAQSKRTAVLHVQGALPPALIDYLSSHRLFIGHNIAAFDLLFLARAGVDISIPIYYDSLIAESLTIASARKDLRVSLKASVKRRLGIDLAKDQGQSTWMTTSLTAEQIRYCREDVMYLPRLRSAQIKAMGTEQIRALNYEHRLLPSIVRMSLRGLPFDYSRLEAYEARLQEQQDWSLAYLQEKLGPINLLSPVQVVKAVQETTGFTLTATTLEAYQALSEEPGELGTLGKALILMKQVLAKDQVIGEMWAEQHVFAGRVYPRYRQVDRDFGRLCVTEPNMEILPRSARELIGGLPDHSVASVTFKNLWWGVVASLARDEDMKSLVDGELIAGLHEKLWGPWEEADMMIQRRNRSQTLAMARSMLFGHPREKLARQLRVAGLTLTDAEIQVLEQRFYGTFPGLTKLHAQARAQAMLPAAPVTFPTGMRRTLAKAAPHQITGLRAKGTVGALIKEGILQLEAADLAQYLHAVVGEEFVFILPNSLVTSGIQEKIETCLEQAAKTTIGFPLPVQTLAGAYWSL